MNKRNVIKALKACKPYLAVSWSDVNYKTQYVCHAVYHARQGRKITRLEEDQAVEYINEQIGTSATVLGYLRDVHGIHTGDAHFNDQQEYRHRWVDHMIKELSK